MFTTSERQRLSAALKLRRGSFAAAVVLLPAFLFGATLFAQPAAGLHAKHVLGLENVKRGAKGSLSIEGAALHFSAGKTKGDMPIASIRDIFTGDESARVVGGTLGTISMFGPYGSGRFLSLFRKKTDALTVEYRDTAGGLHGAIFVLAQGQAAELKKQLVAQGAHASIPVEEELQQRKEKGKKGEQKQ